MQLDDTFTFKKLVGGKYVTEKVKKRQIDDSFSFTVVKNNKKLKSQDKINLGSKDKNEIFFEFQVVKENKKENKIKNEFIENKKISKKENKIKNEFSEKKEENKIKNEFSEKKEENKIKNEFLEKKEENKKVNNLKIKKPIIKKPVNKKTVAKNTTIKPINKIKESPKIDETQIVKSNPLLLYKQIKGPDRFKELLIKCSFFLKDGDFKKNLPSFVDKLTICADLQNLKGEINNLNFEIEKWRKIKEEKIKELKKIEIKSIKINFPEITYTPKNVLEEGKKSLLNAITYLEKRVERLNVVAEDMIEKNIKPKPKNCTVLLAELAKLD